MQRWAFPVFAVAMLVVPLLPVPDFWITQLNLIGLSSMAALGLVLLTGIAGLMSFGQAAFVGVGAYTAGWLAVNAGVSPWLTLPVGIALAVAVALVLGAATLTMSGHYLPLATIAWGLAIYYAASNMEWLGKYDGLLGVPPIALGSWSLGSGRGIYVLIWLLALALAWGMLNLLDSRPGRAIRSLGAGTTMAEAMGISTFRYKMVAFVLSAVLAAISGWLFAHFQRTVNPTPFGLHKGIEYLFMAVLGGVGHVWGAFVGAGVVTVVEDQLQVLLPKLIGTSGNFEIIVFGIVLVLVLKYAPDGVWPFVARALPARRRVRDWEAAPKLPTRAKPAHGELLLEVDSARKEFGGLVAVRDVSFAIRAGEIIGLIGPNGAGKSTTFKMLCGLLKPTSGEAHVAGLDLRRATGAAKARLGYMAQKFSLYGLLSVRQNLEFSAGVYGLDGTIRRTRIDEMVETFDLGRWLSAAPEALPLGYRQRLALACALMHRPPVLFLDEPTSGVDPITRREFWTHINGLARKGVTVMVTTHFMDEAEYCDRVAMLSNARLIALDTPDALKRGAASADNPDPTMEDAFIHLVESAEQAGKAQAA